MALAKTTNKSRGKTKPGKIAIVGTMTIYDAATQKKICSATSTRPTN